MFIHQHTQKQQITQIQTTMLLKAQHFLIKKISLLMFYKKLTKENKSKKSTIFLQSKIVSKCHLERIKQLEIKIVKKDPMMWKDHFKTIEKLS